jgi:ketosteroid isomerase-like protein
MTDSDERKPIELVFRLLSGDFELLSSTDHRGVDFLAGLIGAIDETFVLHVLSGLPELSGDFYGHKGIAEYTTRLSSMITEFDNTVETVASDSDQNFLVGLTRSALASANGRRVSVSVCTVSRVVDGKVAEAWQFSSSLNNAADVRDALGLSSRARAGADSSR